MVVCWQYVSASSDKTVRIWNSWRVAPRRKKLSKMKGASGLNMLDLEKAESVKNEAEEGNELESDDEDDDEELVE